MKKLGLGIAIATLAISCQKVTEGGNQGVLRMQDGIDRYDNTETRGTATPEEVAMPATTDSVAGPTAVEMRPDSLKQTP